MSISQNFQFSQGSLQDYVDCPRRFQLKYVQQLAWPAVDAEPALENELYLKQGSAFHRLVQQYLLGVSAEKLTPLAAQDLQLARWWENFLSSAKDLAGLTDTASVERFPEISLSAPLGRYRLVGKYDLLVIDRTSEPYFTIYDWKTSRKQPKREWLAANLQTRVYPYLLTRAGADLNAQNPIAPEKIEMVYWFANFPGAPLRFPYSPTQCTADEKFITDLIAEIDTLGDEPAPLTDNEKRCRYCVYRSLCNRGIQAGPFSEAEDEAARDDFDFELDFEQIAEIEF
jgi:hypothetical protein